MARLILFFLAALMAFIVILAANVPASPMNRRRGIFLQPLENPEKRRKKKIKQERWAV